MDVLHITQTKNISSIMKNGILRSKPLLTQYDRIMKRDYRSAYDSDKGMIFGWPENLRHRDKYLKDFFYWKTWGTQRNEFLPDDYHLFNKCQEIGPSVFSHIKIEPIYFSIILIDIPQHPLYAWYLHAQYNNMGVLWSNMDTRYEHDDNPLVLINYDVKPENIKGVIGTGESMITKKNKIDVSLKI